MLTMRLCALPFISFVPMIVAFYKHQQSGNIAANLSLNHRNLPRSKVSSVFHSVTTSRTEKDILFSSNEKIASSETTNIADESDEKTRLVEVTNILTDFDRSQAQYAKSNGMHGLGGGTSSSLYYKTLSKSELDEIRRAVFDIASIGHLQRDKTGWKHGRTLMGICGENVNDGLACLKSWVTALNLPRGLLHGADEDGVPIDPETLGSVYIKYNTGGSITFTEMRQSGTGFDGLWKPGDAMLEGYDGDFRGVYLNVELEDAIFRQFGVLPLDLFEDAAGQQ